MKHIQDLIFQAEGTVSHNFGSNIEESHREFVRQLTGDVARRVLHKCTVKQTKGDFQTTFCLKVLICTEDEFMAYVHDMAQEILSRSKFGNPSPMILTKTKGDY